MLCRDEAAVIDKLCSLGEGAQGTWRMHLQGQGKTLCERRRHGGDTQMHSRQIGL